MLYKALHLEPDENVVLEVRKHWIVFFSYGLVLVFSAILPVILLRIIEAYIPNLLELKISYNQTAITLFLYSLWLLFLWISFFVEWTKYYLDVWYVTEKRIIAIDQKDIFHREISNLHFNKIQDVTLEINGLIPTFLKFGDIRVLTASEDSKEFFMKSVRRPEEVRRVIFGHQNKIIDAKQHHL